MGTPICRGSLYIGVPLIQVHPYIYGVPLYSSTPIYEGAPISYSFAFLHIA